MVGKDLKVNLYGKLHLQQQQQHSLTGVCGASVSSGMAPEESAVMGGRVLGRRGRTRQVLHSTSFLP